MWKPVEYKDIKRGCYLVSDDGQVWSNYRNRPVSQNKNGGGYLVVRLRKEDMTTWTLGVHRLVCHAFHGDPPEDMIRPSVNHIDYNKENNNADNLEWMSLSDNASNKQYGGRGEHNPYSRMTDEKAKELCQYLSTSDDTLAKISRELGISHHIVEYVAEGRAWTHISAQYMEEIKKHNASRYKRMIEAFGKRKSLKAWATMFGLSDRTLKSRLDKGTISNEVAIATPPKTHWLSMSECEERFRKVIKHNAKTDEGQ